MTSIQLTAQDYYTTGITATQKQLKKTSFAAPSLSKIVINVGIGKFKTEKSSQDEIVDLVEKLTGQVPRKIYTKAAISGFKLKPGDLVGVQVTLRGQKMMDFLLNLVYISLPRTKDFKGVKSTSWDSNFACFSVGIADSSIFPQIGFSAKVNFGMQVNLCFTQNTPDNKILLDNLQFPFSKK